MTQLGWIVLGVGVVVFFVIDLLMARDQNPTLKRSLWASIFWMSLGLLVTVPLLIFDTSDHSVEYLTGFLLEKSLSLDNLFVFSILFTALAVPAHLQRRALMLGIGGAIILRGIMILIGGAAIEQFEWLIYLFGAFLLLTAINLIRHHGVSDPTQNPVYKWLIKHFPVTTEFHEHKITVREAGKRMLTPIGLTLIMIAALDLLFAVDSVPAIFGVTENTWIVLAANAMSLLGMTSLYFLLHNLLDRFRYLSQALAIVLGFIGLKMLLHSVIHISNVVSLLVVIGVLAAAMVLSWWVAKREAQAGITANNAADDKSSTGGTDNDNNAVAPPVGAGLPDVDDTAVTRERSTNTPSSDTTAPDTNNH